MKYIAVELCIKTSAAVFNNTGRSRICLITAQDEFIKPDDFTEIYRLFQHIGGVMTAAFSGTDAVTDMSPFTAQKVI